MHESTKKIYAKPKKIMKTLKGKNEGWETATNRKERAKLPRTLGEQVY